MYDSAAMRQPVRMITLRPILSESQPKTRKNGVPSATAQSITVYDCVKVSFRYEVMKKFAWNWPWYQTTPWPAVRPSRTRRIVPTLRPLKLSLAQLPALVTDWFAALRRANSGVSRRRMRMYSATMSSSAPRMNGYRQPTLAKSAVAIVVRKERMTANAKKKPSVADVWIHDVYRPRLLSGACSAT